MSLFFLSNNLHFALEVFGALSFFVMAWLALDAFLLKRSSIVILRVIGFSFFAVFQIIHAFNFGGDLWGYAGYGIYIIGLVLVFSSFVLEMPPGRPELKAIFILPAFSAALLSLNIIATVGLLAITFLSFRQYRVETKKALKPFWMGFLFLSIGAFTPIFYGTNFSNPLWTVGHIFELLGFLSLGWWVWQYLQLRIREEMILIFVSMALLIATVVTLVFSTILVNQIESETKENLLTNTRVLDFAILRLKEEALAKAKLLSSNGDITKSLAEDNFVALEELATQFLEQEKLGFLTVLDDGGSVILRAHALTQKEDNLFGERAVQEAFSGNSFVNIESSPAEKFSIRAASPILSGGDIIGVIITGFPLDNALVDNIKRITGLEMSIFQDNTRVATTVLNPDRRTRSIGIKVTDKNILESVLKKGLAKTGRIDIISRPFLVSYLPLINEDSNIVGMISSSKPQKDLLEVSTAINRLTFIVIGIIMLILVMPIYFITRRLGQEIS